MSQADLDAFYGLLADLERRLGQKYQLKDCHGRMNWSEHGIYFFYEAGEYRSSQPDQPRVVRVGTHGLHIGSKSTLWQRLYQHRGTNKGTGNHRGSIFRLHVGQCIIERDHLDLPTWGQGSSANKQIRQQEKAHEQRVSACIGQMPFLWLAVGNKPDQTSDRGLIERNAIALLSNGYQPPDPASPTWLGRYSNRPQIVQSSLWNVNHVEDGYDPAFLSVMRGYVEQM